MEENICVAKKREFTGKGNCRKIREMGFIPAILYGKHSNSISLVINPKDIINLFKKTDSNNPVFNIRIEGEGSEKKVLLKDYQVHPVRRNLLHCDFMEIRDDEPVTVEVPIKTTGKSEAEKSGGIITILCKSIKIRCLPSEIPPCIEVDVTGLRQGQSIFIEDLKLKEGIKTLYKKNIAVVGARIVKEEVIEAKPSVEAVVEEAAEEGKMEGEKKEEETPKKVK